MFTEPYEISQNALARALNLPPRHINQIIHGKRPITPRTAILLGDLFQSGAPFWMKLQAEYDIDRTRRRGVRLDMARVRANLRPIGLTVPFDGGGNLLTELLDQELADFLRELRRDRTEHAVAVGGDVA
ncbi:hypothetical protein DSM104440_03611 [Usitatibacter palustris]|uniref:HTH cro/C1-type domain-containing protein n=2 Tax=Usitatibacter palustris TaxID=2732487 RepID=A0A6M4HCI0_9PROT|nr:hypothetical protein DSM104440_03611 [Usitatibacter palustris]